MFNRLNLYRYFISSIFCLLGSNAEAQVHKGLTFQAAIRLPSGEPANVSSLNIKAQILSMDNCILREETFANSSVISGYVSLNIGTGTVGGADPGLSLKQVMDNSKTINAVTCLNNDGTVKNSQTSFNPSTTSGARKLRLTFDIASETITADFNIRAVSYALNAESFDGKSTSDFIQTSTHLTQATLESFIANLTAASGNAIKWNGSSFVAYNPNDGSALSASSISSAAISSLEYSKLTSVPSSLSQIGGLSCADGKILKKASGAWACADDNTGSSVTFGTIAGTVAEGNDSRIVGAFQSNASLGGDLSGTLPNPLVNGIKGQAISAAGTSAGQVLRYAGGATWTPGFVAMTDLKSSVTGGNSFASSCSANQTLTYNSVGDVMSCTAITGIPAGNITGLAASATTDATNANNISSGELNSARLPTSITNALWSESSGDVSRTAGKVGVGTVSPGAKFAVHTTTEDYISLSTVDTTSATDTANIIYKIKAGPGVTSGGDTVSRGKLEFKSEGTVNNGDTVLGVYTFDGNVGIGEDAPQAKLAVAGAIKLGNTSALCDASSEGQQRYNSTLKRMEFCDGNLWQSLGAPSGAVQAFAQSSCPSGWLEANGSAISRVSYAALFATIGTSYGGGDGTTTFNLPNYRGYFLRGWDHGAGVDPNAATRTDRGDGSTGDVVGSKQASSNKAESISIAIPVHSVNAGETNVPSTSLVLAKSMSGTTAAKVYTSQNPDTTLKPFDASAPGASESRPLNINVLYCIRY